MKAIFVNVVVGGFLTDADAAEVVMAINVVGGAAFTDWSGGRMVDGEDKLAFEHDSEIEVA